MDTFLGIVALIAIVVVVLVVRRALRSEQPPRPRPARSLPSRPSRGAPPRMQQAPRVAGEPSAGDEISGWLVGHEVAHGHGGFPGDPLPGGHLGSAADLAFWGSAFDDDEDDEDG